MEAFDISIEGFSGPLDLLCSLVESRQFQASQIKVTQLVRIYGAYLARTRRASVDTLAEFFYMVAGLLLQKTRSLLPGALPEPDLEEALEDEMDEGAFMEMLDRYRPYRAAYRWLTERKEREARSFRRQSSSKPREDGETVYDVGDLYFLARVWWGTYERYTKARRRRRRALEQEEMADWDGFAEPIPDEEQIQTRIAELEEQLAAERTLFLSALCRSVQPVRILVVTLLALLEMCRMGKITIEQEALFGDVKVLARNP